MADGESKGFCNGKCCMGWTVFLTGLICFSISFATIGPLDAGLKYDTVTVSYDYEKVYKSGRYVVGPGKTIDPFPMTWRPLMFCNDCPEKDLGPVSNKAAGQGGSPVTVDLEVFIYYKLKAARLAKLVKNFPSKNYHSKFVKVASSAIKNEIAVHGVNEMLEEREKLAHDMARIVNPYLVSEGAYIVACYLGTVGLQESSDQAYLDQWVSIRRKITSFVQGEVLEIQQSTAAAVSEETKIKDVMLSKQYQLGNTTIERAKAAGEELILKAQGTAFRQLQDRMNFTQSQLLKYIYYEKIRNTRAALVAGFSTNDKLLSA